MSFSLPLVGVAVLQAVVYVFFVRAVDLYEREPLWYVIPVFVWGFTVAVGVSLLFNTLAAVAISAIAGAQVASLLTAIFVAPVVEESAKGLAVLLVFVIAYLVSRRRGAMEFSGVMDGIVYGAAVGFGFSIAEDLLYYAQAGQETFIVRRIFGGFAHAAFTSLTGVGLGLVPWVRPRALKVALPVLGLVGAMLLHSFFNLTASLLGPAAYLLLAVVVLLYVVLILLWLAVERRSIRGELRDEVPETVSAEEYEMIPTYFSRKSYYLRLLLTGRLSTWRRVRRVHAAAVDLAFTKRLARRSRADTQTLRLQHLRGRISDLRGGEASRLGS